MLSLLRVATYSGTQGSACSSRERARDTLRLGREHGDRATATGKLNTFECLRFLAINSLRRGRLEKDALEGTAPDRYVISERQKGPPAAPSDCMLFLVA